MSSRIRRWFESIIYAGMQPGQPVRQTVRSGWLEVLRHPVERFLSGGPAPLDPLYLTNRTVGQKVRSAVLVLIPCLIAAAFVALALGNYFKKATPVPRFDLTDSELAKSIPKVDYIKPKERNDLEVTEVSVEQGSTRAVVGTIRNTTSHPVRTVEIVFDLTDGTGSLLGGVSKVIANLAPQSQQRFRLPIEETAARLAMVREIRTP